MGELTDKWGQSMGGDQETMMMVTTLMSTEVWNFSTLLMHNKHLRSISLLSWKSVLVFAPTGGGRFSNLIISKVVGDINKLFSCYKNLVFWASSGLGFMSLSQWVLEWQLFKKKRQKNWVLSLNKTGQFWAILVFWKIGRLWETVVVKPLNPQKTKGYQWKDNVHIFHLMPSSTLCDHWFGHRIALNIGPFL